MERTGKGGARRILLLVAAAVVGFGLGIGAGLWIQSADVRGESAAIASEALSGAGHTVLPGTRMQREHRFALCGHTIVKAIDTNAFLGYTEADLRRFYSPDEIFFSGDRVIITHQADGCCPMHYLLRYEETNRLNVYRTDVELMAYALIHALPEETAQALGTEVCAALRSGMLFDELSDVDAYLESMES